MVCPYYTLSNGDSIPRVGLGVYKSQGDEGRQAVCFALQNGYRLLDTATLYGNEAMVGEGIRDAGLPREQVFITSKVAVQDMGYEETLAAFQRSLEVMKTDYLDLYLLHWPVESLWQPSWRALEALYEKGLAKAIGVCNFPVFLLEQMEREVRVMPMVNQIQYNPLFQRGEELAYCSAHNILVQAWAPLARGALDTDPLLAELAGRYGRSPAQIILRWELQLGLCTIPKTVHKERILQNIDLFDFELTPAEMQRMTAMDRQLSSSKLPDGVISDKPWVVAQ